MVTSAWHVIQISEKSMSNNKKRQTVYIQKDFQRRSILVVILIITASGLLSAALLYFLLSSELSAQLQAAHLQIQDTWDRLAPAVIFGNIITVLVTSIAAAVAVLYQSHKIAGPMYRLEKVCDEVANGNLSPITSLRKADQLTALAAAFETMVTNLRDKDTERTKIINESLAILNNLETSSDGNDSESLTTVKLKLERLLGG